MVSYYELMTVAEVAAALPWGSPRIYKMIREGKLTSIKRGRAHLIPKEMVLAYIQLLMHEQAQQAL